MPPASDPAPTTSDPPLPPRPWRELLRALLWVLVAELSAVIAAGIAGFVVGLTNALAKQHGGELWQPSPLAHALIGMLALQATLLLGALKRGRSVGRGDLAVGLGAGPMRRKGLIAMFACLMVAWLFVFVAIVIHFAAIRGAVLHGLPTALTLPVTASPVLLTIRLIVITFLAPTAEELFFRGWLWTVLQRSWGVWATAFCTGGLWLAVHAIDGPARALVLLPGAILLSLARHFGGSVRASLAVHITNNAVTSLLQLAALALA